jgi:hemerythrin superfamily protein
MDAISVLKQQHAQVNELFSKFEKADSGKEDLVTQICEKLTIHDKIERDIFYPAVIQEGAEIQSIILEGLEEHHLMQVMLKQLADIDSADETFEAKVKVLKELVTHHVNEEETALFKMVREVVNQEVLGRIGTQLEKATNDLIAQEPQVTITMLGEVTLETPTLNA